MRVFCKFFIFEGLCHQLNLLNHQNLSFQSYSLSKSQLICHIFSHSPVYRIGGDEFVALLTNDDYMCRNDLMSVFNNQIDHNLENGKVVVSSGMSIFDSGIDKEYDEVFARADKLMYDRKKELKMRKKEFLKAN